MKKIVKTLLTMLLVTSLLAGCTDGAVTARLAAADSLMADHPDSALALLGGMQAEKAGWAESQQMRHALLTAKAMNKAFVNFTTDSVMREVADYYDSHGTANDRLLAHYLLGCTYRDLGETPRAVDSFMDAIAEADTTAKDCDFYTLSTVYSQMADAFHLQLLLTNEIEARRQASKYAFMANRPYWGIYNQDMAVGAYILLNKLDSAEILQKKVIKLYQNYNYPQAVIRASRALLHLYVESSDRLSETKPLLDKLESEYGKFDEHHELPPSERQYFYYKGRYYEHLGLLDSAEYFYRKIYRPSMSYTAKDPMYKGLLSIFRKRHQPDSIAKYAQLYCEANDSSIIRKDQELTSKVFASYRYNHILKEALDNENIAYKRLVSLIIASIICGSLLLLTLYTWKDSRGKHLQTIKNLKTEFAETIEEYRENLNKIKLLESTHQRVISIIQQELACARNENEAIRDEFFQSQMTISRLNEEYETDKSRLIKENEQLKARINELQSEEIISKHLKKSDAFSKEPIVERLRTISHQPQMQMSDSEWNELAEVFRRNYPILIHDLTQNCNGVQNIRVCILTALGINSGEQANILGITKQRVSNTKSLVNRCLFNESSSRSLQKNLIVKYNIYDIEA